MANPVIQFKRGVLANLPGLQAGEPGFTTDSYDLYVGLTSETATNKIVGSARFWTNNTSSTGSGVNLVEGTSNGTSFITLKAPDSLAGIVTYIMPGTDGTDGQFLKTNGSGQLSFADVSTNLSIAGGIGTDTVSLLTDTLTFAGTANEIETAVTNNQVQIGLPDNVIVGAALTVTGPLTANGDVTLGNADSDVVTVVGVATFTTSNVYIDNQLFVGGFQVNGGATIGEDITTRNFKATGVSTFVGAVTFEGGTINLGDSNTDDINVAGEFISNLVPNTDATYDLGTGSQRWRDANFSGIVTATTINASGSVRTPLFNSSNTTLQAPTIGNFAGERIRLYDFNSESNTNYAVGVETNHVWFGVDNYGENQGFKWYGEETQVMRLSGVGNLTVEGNISVKGTGISTFAGLLDANGGLDVTGQTILNNSLSVSGITTLGTGVGVTQFSSAVGSGASTSSVPTSSAVIDYVGTQISNVDLTTGIAGDTGTGSVSTSQSLTVAGTAGEIETSASGQTITVGLPDTVIVGTAVSTPTLQVATIKHSNGTNAATIDTSGNLTAAQNLTVSGNLYVNGSTTQVNTASMTVEDRTIELGQVDGSTPSSATTWDLGVLFNYNSSGAKKSAVIWEHADGRFKFGSQVTDGGGTDNDSPQITVSNYAAIEIGALWVNDCAGQSQVISCTGSTRYLENITIDGGEF